MKISIKTQNFIHRLETHDDQEKRRGRSPASPATGGGSGSGFELLVHVTEGSHGVAGHVHQLQVLVGPVDQALSKGRTQQNRSVETAGGGPHCKRGREGLNAADLVGLGQPLADLRLLLVGDVLGGGDHVEQLEAEEAAGVILRAVRISKRGSRSRGRDLGENVRNRISLGDNVGHHLVGRIKFAGSAGCKEGLDDSLGNHLRHPGAHQESWLIYPV